MSNQKKQSSRPPQPPAIDRRLQFNHLQMIGMPLVMLIPILALFGIFGKTIHEENASNSQLRVQVEYPTRFRYKMIDSIQVSLLNASDQPLDSIQVSFDRAYIEAFSTVTFTPAVKHITEEAYLVEITDLQPGDARRISVTIQAETYGKHDGSIIVTSENAERLQMSISTFAFP